MYDKLAQVLKDCVTFYFLFKNTVRELVIGAVCKYYIIWSQFNFGQIC